MLTRELLRILSAIAAILTGIIVLILWIIAANDRGKEDGRYACRGCNQIFNTAAKNSGLGYGSGLTTWILNNMNPYPLLIAFGVILGVFWMVTGAIGFVAASKYMAWVYLILALITYLIFVVMFPIIVERINFANANCSSLWAVQCKTDDDWRVRHSVDSYEQFWGASLVGFILGAFVIGSAIYMIHENEEPLVPTARAAEPVPANKP